MNKKSNNIIYFLLSAIVSIILLTFTNIDKSINNNAEASIKSFYANDKADTNIVLITIDETDIQQLGGWPLKRSYYALLFNKLNNLDVRAVGLEVFLSDLVSSQSIYSELLLDQAKNYNNIVFGSIISSIKKDGDKYISDSIQLPFVAKLSSIKSGHLSYISKSSGIILPLKIENNLIEKAFALSLAEISDQIKIDRPDININFDKSWKEYKSLSLLEFFQVYENDEEQLAYLKNKIVLIGITAQSLAKNLNTIYDDELPGIGFHAIALENILNDNFYDDSYYSISALFLFLLAFIPVFFKRTSFIIYLSILAFTVIIAFTAITLFNVLLNYASFVLPFLFNLLTALLVFVNSRKEETESVIKEKDLILKELTDKTNQLDTLQNELELESKNSSHELLDKVTQLKQEVLELRNRHRDSEEVKFEEQNRAENFHGIIFKSKEMRQIVSTIKKVADEKATILIMGESGSGKELVARAIHNLSSRKNKNFVAVNCAALSDTLLESELFGHVKGSFTNAISDKKGLFEEANNGTILLDEIGETSETFQTKLLRVLQNGEIQKVGSAAAVKVDVRIIAATNKNLKALVDAKIFREDLYYRLNVIQIKIPPLRERKEDIPAIIEFFLEKEDGNFRVSKAVMDILLSNEWKGNVRELESIIKRAVIYAKSEEREVIQLKDLPDELSKLSKSNMDDVIIEALAAKNFSHSSINETASDLNLSRTLVSENLRGYLFKNLVKTNFDIDLAVVTITKDKDSADKLKSKLQTYLTNIKKDLEKLESKDFDFIKTQFASKYKNLPQKYHSHLDEIIKYLLNS